MTHFLCLLRVCQKHSWICLDLTRSPQWLTVSGLAQRLGSGCFSANVWIMSDWSQQWYLATKLYFYLLNFWDVWDSCLTNTMEVNDILSLKKLPICLSRNAVETVILLAPGNKLKQKQWRWCSVSLVGCYRSCNSWVLCILTGSMLLIMSSYRVQTCLMCCFDSDRLFPWLTWMISCSHSVTGSMLTTVFWC